MKLAIALKHSTQPCGEPALKKDQLVEIVDNTNSYWTRVATSCGGRRIYVPSDTLRILNDYVEEEKAMVLYCKAKTAPVMMVEEKVQD